MPRLLVVTLAVLAAMASAAPAAAAPRLSVEPSAARPGDPVLITGAGFRPRSVVGVSASAPWVAELRARTDARGRFRRALPVPAGIAEGTYAIRACQGACRVARIRVTTTTGWTRWVRAGEIEVGSGAAGVTIGMPRRDVLAQLGKPFFTTRFGYMQYAPDATNIFDVYTGDTSLDSPVRQIVISFGRFRIDGIAVFDRGSLSRLKRRFGRALRRTRIESGDVVYRVTTQAPDGVRWTDFVVERPNDGLRARILNVIVLDAD